MDRQKFRDINVHLITYYDHIVVVLNNKYAGCIYLPVTYCGGNWEFLGSPKTEKQ